jgi:outer membrane protein TolC
VRAARGPFDPLLGVSGTYGDSRFEDVQDALPISGSDRTWDVSTWITGITATGTTYPLGAASGFDRSFATGLQPVYDDGGEQIGTAPFEATARVYSSSLTFTLSQHLMRGVLLGYNLQTVRLARHAESLAELGAEQLEQQAIADTAAQYWTWVRSVRLHAIDVLAVATAEEALRVATLQVQARRLAPVERTRLESAWVLAQSTAATSGVLATQARDLLLVLMGEMPGQDVEPASDPGDPPVVALDVERVTAKALEQNVDLRIAREALATETYAWKMAKHGRLPSLEAKASVGRTTGNQPTWRDAVQGLAGEDGQPSLTIGGVLTVPIGNRAADGAADATAYDRSAAANAVLELEQQIRAQVAYQVALLESAHERVAAADAGVRLAEETLAAMDALAAANRAIPKDVLEARTLLDRAKVEAVRSRTDWRVAHTELGRLQSDLGTVLP